MLVIGVVEEKPCRSVRTMRTSPPIVTVRGHRDRAGGQRLAARGLAAAERRAAGHRHDPQDMSHGKRSFHLVAGERPDDPLAVSHSSELSGLNWLSLKPSWRRARQSACSRASRASVWVGQCEFLLPRTQRHQFLPLLVRAAMVGAWKTEMPLRLAEAMLEIAKAFEMMRSYPFGWCGERDRVLYTGE